MEGNQAALRQTLAELTSEERSLRETANSAERKKETADENYQKSAGKLREALRLYERTKDTVAEQEEDLSQFQSSLKKRKTESSEAEKKLESIKKEKEVLMEQIGEKKRQAKKQVERQREEKEQLRNRIKSEVDKVKLEMGKQAKSAEEESSKMGPELEGAREGIEENKQEYAHLVQEISDFRDSLGRLDNPLKEIIRVEYKLKKLRARKA